MPEYGPQQVTGGGLSVSQGQNIVASLQAQQNEGWNIATTPRGEAIVFRAEAHSPFAVTDMYVLPSSQTEIKITSLQQLASGRGQRQQQTSQQQTAPAML